MSLNHFFGTLFDKPVSSINSQEKNSKHTVTNISIKVQNNF